MKTFGFSLSRKLYHTRSEAKHRVQVLPWTVYLTVEGRKPTTTQREGSLAAVIGLRFTEHRTCWSYGRAAYVGYLCAGGD